MGKNKNWTDEEVNYLESSWGIVSIPGIARHLKRSIEGIKSKAQRQGLGRHIHGSEDITLNQLAQALGRSYKTIINNWIQKCLPFRYRKSVSKEFKVISIPDFWRWAEQHRTIINFAKVELNILGEEPEWVREQRSADFAAMKYKETPWALKEDQRLISLVKAYKFGFKDISQMLNRTTGAIQRRLNDLGIKERPLKADNHTKWTQEEVDVLIRMKSRGYKSDVISEYISGKSAKAVQGKLERMEYKKNSEALRCQAVADIKCGQTQVL